MTETKPKIVYKIRHKDGTFSTGGMHPYFTSKGKIWHTLGALKNHLNYATNSYYNRKHVGILTAFSKYADSEVIAYEMISVERETPFDLKDYFKTKIDASIVEAASAVKNDPKMARYYYPLQAVYPDGTVIFIDPNDTLNG